MKLMTKTKPLMPKCTDQKMPVLQTSTDSDPDIQQLIAFIKSPKQLSTISKALLELQE